MEITPTTTTAVKVGLVGKNKLVHSIMKSKSFYSCPKELAIMEKAEMRSLFK